MNTIPIIFTIASAFFVALSMVVLKKGAETLTLRNWFTHKTFIGGVALFGLANLMLIVVLRTNDVSVVFPLTSVQYVFGALISYYYLKERFNKLLVLGIAFIVLGSILVVL